jgi:hypothetical protein
MSGAPADFQRQTPSAFVIETSAVRFHFVNNAAKEVVYSTVPPAPGPEAKTRRHRSPYTRAKEFLFASLATNQWRSWTAWIRARRSGGTAKIAAQWPKLNDFQIPQVLNRRICFPN